MEDAECIPYQKGISIKMKKTILIILAVLPIVLLVVISVAGWWSEFLGRVPVDNIEFVNAAGKPYGENVFKVAQGKTRETYILFDPEEPTNKRVTYSSEDESICTVDENGVITGVHWGDTQVKVKTDDGEIVATLNVKVTADTPFAVYLTPEEISLKVTQTYVLGVEVDAPVSLDRSVTFSSDKPDVATVDVNGKVVACGVGTATITVTTVLGEKTDTCVVTVLDGKPPIYFDIENDPDIVMNSSKVYVCSRSVIDIMSMLTLEEGIDPNSVKIEMTGGADKATLVGGILTINKRGIVTVRVSAVDQNGMNMTTELKFGLQSD